MSVIFGITEENRIILAGDKRVTDVTDGSFSDDAQKVIQINKQLCIAFAGNMAVMTSIMKKVEATENKDTLVTDDLLEIINSFYKKVVEKECDVIYGYAFYCLIAGKGKDGKDYFIMRENLKMDLNIEKFLWHCILQQMQIRKSVMKFL